MPRPPNVAVVDYGFGNVRSVAKALDRSGLVPEVTADPAAVRRADGVVLPGVGNFHAAAASLRDKGLDAAVRAAIEAGRPYLGLCLGLQLLFADSDEHGRTPGWGLLPGRVRRFPERDPEGRPLRVPHIGWSRVRFRGEHPILAALPAEDYYYFVHSYRAEPERGGGGAAGPADAGDPVVGTADYGGELAAAVARDRIFAVQFHPEKSQMAGKRLLDAYAAWVERCR